MVRGHEMRCCNKHREKRGGFDTELHFDVTKYDSIEDEREIVYLVISYLLKLMKSN